MKYISLIIANELLIVFAHEPSAEEGTDQIPAQHRLPGNVSTVHADCIAVVEATVDVDAH